MERIDVAADELGLAGVDGVFHLAGQPGVSSFGGVFPVYVRQNVLASERLFAAAAAAGARTVFASSSSIYGDAESYPTREDAVPRPISPYGITKLACEHLGHAYHREFGLDHVVVRYFTIFGPRQRPDMALAKIVACLVEGRPFELHHDGTQSRSFTYVDDAVEATILAMERGSTGDVFNVGGGEEVSMREAIDTLAERRRARARAGAGSAPPGRPEPDARRHLPDPREDGLGAANAVRRGTRGSMALGR